MPVPDYADPRPAKAQIADDLRTQISAGDYAPGDKLPPVRALAEHYHVVTGTIREAIGVLRSEGVVETHSTRGTYVLNPQGAQPRTQYEVVMGRLDELAEEVRQLREEVAEAKRAAAK